MAQIRGAETASLAASVTVTTTTETVAIVSPPLAMQSPTQRIVIWVWGQLLVGAGATGITPRVRRGNGITGAIVGSGILEAVLGAAGSVEPKVMLVLDLPPAEDVMQYSFTLQQAAATGNGTIEAATILVLAF